MRLNHPLLGRTRRWSAIGVSACALLAVGVALNATVLRSLVDRMPVDLLPVVDGVMTGLIFSGVLVATVFPIGYAVLNRGPAIVIALAITPHVTSRLVTGTNALTNDLVLALVGAAVGSMLAVWLGAYDRYTAPDRRGIAFHLDGLLLTSATTVVAVVGVLRFEAAASAWLLATVSPWQWVVTLPVVTGVVAWLAVMYAYAFDARGIEGVIRTR